MTKKVPMLMKNEAMRIGSITLRTDTPAAFRAMSSLFSPIFPMVIIEASSVASGSASGSTVQLPQKRNSATMPRLRPLPTSSSM